MIQQNFSMSHCIIFLEFLNVYIYRKLAEFSAEFDFRVSQDFHLAEDIELKKQLIDLFPVPQQWSSL